MNRYTASVSVMTLGLGLAIVAYAEIGSVEQTLTAGQQTMSEPLSQNIITGEIREIDGEYYVIRDSSGNEVRIHVDAFALNVGGHIAAFKAGDEIEAELTPHPGQIADGRTPFVTTAGYGHAKSLKAVENSSSK